MEKTADTQISSSKFPFRPSLLVVAIFVSCLILTFFPTFGLSPFLVTAFILFLSTIFIVRCSKNRNVVTVEIPARDESPPPKSVIEKEGKDKLNPELEAVAECNPVEESEVCHVHEYQVESTDFPSDSESSDDFSANESFKANWTRPIKVDQNLAISESSVSDDDLEEEEEEEEEDDDNLIEISLPKIDSVDLIEDSKQKLKSKFPDYLPQSIFSLEGLTELLEEINEVNEENLIEIDLSMGSIKYPAFEIEA